MMTEIRKVLQAHINGVEEQQSITWCITHHSSGRGPSPIGDACHYSALYQATLSKGANVAACEFSDGGPAHKWWVDLDA